MKSMFYNCKSLNNIDLSSYNPQKVTNMEYMFYGCKSLKNIFLNSFNTQKVTTMRFKILKMLLSWKICLKIVIH
jgi:surface protein